MIDIIIIAITVIIIILREADGLLTFEFASLDLMPLQLPLDDHLLIFPSINPLLQVQVVLNDLFSWNYSNKCH